MTLIKILVAYCNNRGIGINNKLPWHLPSDLKRFKELTTDNIVIMGRKTWSSLPIYPLPNRLNIVLTKDRDYVIDHPNVKVFNDFTEALDYLDVYGINKVAYVIGGGEIYKQAISYTDEILATEIDMDCETDTFFPNISDRIWKISDTTPNVADHTGLSNYVTYTRF